MNTSIGGEENFGTATRARNSYISETAFFFETRAAAFIKRALVWKQAFFPAGQEHSFKFQTFGAMQRHNRNALGRIAFSGFHHQRNMFEERCKVREFFHRADEFF